MNADLERLIQLQQMDSLIESARRRVADHPTLAGALDSRLATATAELEAAKAAQNDNQVSRRAVEKDLASVQGRLSKYKNQLMEVKTNKEYQAMLKEIEVAQHDVQRLEDQILEHMLAADDISARVKKAEAALKADKQAVADEREQLETETARLQRQLDETTSRRAALAASTPPAVVELYETIRTRRGTAVVELQNGYCSACHVRLRPQAANELRRNEIVFQCESCQRVVYFGVPAAAPAAPDDPPA